MSCLGPSWSAEYSNPLVDKLSYALHCFGGDGCSGQSLVGAPGAATSSSHMSGSFGNAIDILVVAVGLVGEVWLRACVAQ